MSLELSESLQKTVDALTESFSKKILDVYQSSGRTFVLVDLNSIIEISTFLKENQHFTYLADVFGIDRYTSDDRFEVVYNLISLKNGDRLFVKVRCEEENPEVDSVTSVWQSAGWNEREVYDMFGIKFNNHPDLRRIFMPEDFEYFPLRKEFPLLGIPGSIDLPNSTPDTE
ncbi:NADH-quinone oxidoreductase subunit C [Rhodohalobacter halophilus]|uniref:NADH-quinone oxidoreductase subunit C n=1 Tax=Rhodohalobacter halophilus TaxID=1812810 RepID=UPI00083F7D0A|nr:NADH-quinone oxidoreductase subunit C [Rhodohalobacter halophilus]